MSSCVQLPSCCNCFFISSLKYWPVSSVVKTPLSALEVWGSILGRIFRNGSTEKEGLDRGDYK